MRFEPTIPVFKLAKWNAYRIFGEKARRNETIRKRRWEDNIKMDLRETDWDGMNWIHLAQDRDQRRALVNTQ
jgi:hypothetical protein